MAQEISPKDKLEKSIRDALTGAHAKNANGLHCICEKVTGEITVTPVLPEKSDESNIGQWIEVQGTSKASIKIAPDCIEPNITINFTVSTENGEAVYVKLITAQTTTIA